MDAEFFQCLHDRVSYADARISKSSVKIEQIILIVPCFSLPASVCGRPVIFEPVSLSALRYILVFYRFHRAVLDTCHAVSAYLPVPLRPAIVHGDDIKRTLLFTEPAGDTAAVGIKPSDAMSDPAQYRAGWIIDQFLKQPYMSVS